MKKIIFLLIACAAFRQSNGQDFAKRSTEAKTAYAAGKLDDARFAMEQMLQELDIVTGKEVLKMLPAKMGDKSANSKEDNVTGSSGFVGVIIHREYGTVDSTNAELEIISNSPLITSINAILSVPFMGSSGDNKIIKVSGYKALVEKLNSPNEKVDYQVQLPLNNSLITFKSPGASQEDVIRMANTLPVSDIAKMLQ